MLVPVMTAPGFGEVGGTVGYQDISGRSRQIMPRDKTQIDFSPQGYRRAHTGNHGESGLAFHQKHGNMSIGAGADDQVDGL